MSQSISVAVAVYNGAPYLQEQLESLEQQTVIPNEIVICDDRSTDDTVAIAQHFAARSSIAIRLLVNEHNLGYAQNFSRALTECTGDIVFLCDQDDVWLPNKIELMMERFNDDPNVQLLIHDLEFCNEDLVSIGQTKIGRMQSVVDIKRAFVVGMATAVRGPFLKQCLPIPVGITHDRWLHVCAHALSKKAVMRDVLALYRRHGANATNTNIVNAATRVTSFDLQKARLFKRFQPDDVEELLESSLAKWLSDRKTALVLGGYASHEKIESNIAYAMEKIHVLKKRKRICALPKWRRIFPVTAMCIAGEYQRFYSWKSALKDILIQ